MSVGESDKPEQLEPVVHPESAGKHWRPRKAAKSHCAAVRCSCPLLASELDPPKSGWSSSAAIQLLPHLVIPPHSRTGDCSRNAQGQPGADAERGLPRNRGRALLLHSKGKSCAGPASCETHVAGDMKYPGTERCNRQHDVDTSKSLEFQRVGQLGIHTGIAVVWKWICLSQLLMYRVPATQRYWPLESDTVGVRVFLDAVPSVVPCNQGCRSHLLGNIFWHKMLATVADVASSAVERSPIENL